MLERSVSFRKSLTEFIFEYVDIGEKGFENGILIDTAIDRAVFTLIYEKIFTPKSLQDILLKKYKIILPICEIERIIEKIEKELPK